MAPETSEDRASAGAPAVPAGALPSAGADEITAGRQQAARLLTYRMIPLWLFLFTFVVTLVWEVGVRGNAVTAEKLQAAALIALGVALLIGAPVGIRFFNPLPPKT